MQIELSPRVVADPEIFAGKPIIVGTRALVSALVREVATGKPIDVVAEEQRLTSEDVRAALAYAAMRADEAVADGAAPQSVAASPSFAERLATLRAQIVASGDPLLDWDGVSAEVASRRDERYTDTLA